ncbi:hypothetical protein NM688_g6487 [Phlebia brevispora]|uniref:Uncharacterized protein n=1 Tax=Phlebia brevispora TaxID=194682 RepID=A0ACC1SFW4_9APHY|nr:hypothetical protein NM688_g6487 [Phlebia brevispora]
MTIQTFTTLGGTAAGVKVAKIGHGLMMMTWTPNPVPDEVCFEAIKAGVDQLPPGVKMLINSSEFYALDFGPGNLEMLSRFFEKYPEYAERTFLSVKVSICDFDHGHTVSQTDTLNFIRVEPTTKRWQLILRHTANLRRSVTAINAALRGKKKVDLFECARVDHARPIEDIIRDLETLLKEGLFDHIGMSECKAETLRRANAVYPITMVEIEVSPWSIEEETKKVLATAQELNIAVAAYSQVPHYGWCAREHRLRGLPEGDMRRRFSRFAQEEYFKHNMALVDSLKAIAEKKGVTPAALCLAWVASLGPKVIPIPGSSNTKRSAANAATADVKLTEEETKGIWNVVNTYEVKGSRQSFA